jgi:hypothetical protein
MITYLNYKRWYWRANLLKTFAVDIADIGIFLYGYALIFSHSTCFLQRYFLNNLSLRRVEKERSLLDAVTRIVVNMTNSL